MSPFYLHSRSSITHYKFQTNNETIRYFHRQNLLLVPTLREDQGWPFTLRINLSNCIVSQRGQRAVVPFVGQNRCAPLNDARRHLCDGKLTPHGRKGGKSCLFRTVAKRRTAGIKISKPNKFTGARHCRIRVQGTRDAFYDRDIKLCRTVYHGPLLLPLFSYPPGYKVAEGVDRSS